MKPVKAKNLRADMWIAVNYGTAIRALKICEVELCDGMIEIVAHDENDERHIVAVCPPDAVFFASDEGPED